MAKRASKKEAEPEPRAEYLKDGDIVNVICTDHSSGWYWSWTYVYKEEFEDAKGKYSKAVIYDPDRSLFGNGGELAGTFYRNWNDVEFWRKWEGETHPEWLERTKDMKVTLDEMMSGKGARKGDYGPTKIGPAFIPEPVEDRWKLPNDGDEIEIHLENGNYVKGTFFKPANRLAANDGIPMFPFARWIRFRYLNADGSPKSEWNVGPHYKEWSREDRIQRTTKKTERNIANFEKRKADYFEYRKTESDGRIRLVETKKLLANAANSGFDESLDPERLREVYADSFRNGKISKENYDSNIEELRDGLSGNGANFRKQWIDFLHGQIDTLEEALGINPVTKAEAPLVFASVWIGANEEYHKQLHQWLLKGWCRYDDEKKKFVWLGILMDFGFVLTKIDQSLRHKPRWPLLEEEWLFVDKDRPNEKPKPRTAKQISGAYHKHTSKTPPSYSPQLDSLPAS